MAISPEHLKTLRSKLPKYAIENDSYHIGYFTRIAGLGVGPLDDAGLTGWEDANRELAAEGESNAVMVEAVLTLVEHREKRRRGT